jgi:hypothetical protein
MIAITTATIMKTPGTIAANATSIAAEVTSESLARLHSNAAVDSNALSV